MTNINATYKGLITGIAMVIASLLAYHFSGGFDNGLKYLVYSLYVAGIVWAEVDFKNKNATDTTKFKDFFSVGFKCFIVITLIMVLFTAIFIYFHPEMKQQAADFARQQLKLDPNKTPNEIEEAVNFQKKMFLPGYVMVAVMGYLFIGALVSVIVSGFLSQKKTY